MKKVIIAILAIVFVGACVTSEYKINGREVSKEEYEEEKQEWLGK